VIGKGWVKVASTRFSMRRLAARWPSLPSTTLLKQYSSFSVLKVEGSRFFYAGARIRDRTEMQDGGSA
jgi:hypothetical protein